MSNQVLTPAEISGNRRKFYAALRSGEYPKALCHREVYDSVGGKFFYCALGVAGKVLCDKPSLNREDICVLLGFEKLYCWTIMDLNDGTGGQKESSFAELADLMEREYPVS